MRLRLRPKPIEQQTPAGPFRIVVTAVRPNATTAADTESAAWYQGSAARNEAQRPELVVLTVPMPVDGDQAYALGRAAGIIDALPADTRPHYRVKVLAVPR